MTDVDRIDNTKKELINMLKHFNGIISSACEAVGISRQTYYNYLADDKVFAEQVEEINEASIDHVESKLMEKINGVTVQAGEKVYDVPPSDTAIIFFLKTKAKKRGYVERQEVTGADGAPLNPTPIGFTDGSAKTQ